MSRHIHTDSQTDAHMVNCSIWTNKMVGTTRLVDSFSTLSYSSLPSLLLPSYVNTASRITY